MLCSSLFFYFIGMINKCTLSVKIVKPKQSLRRESQVVMNMGTSESVESKKSWKSWMNGKSTRKTCDWENRVECIDTMKKRSYRRETRIAICHYDKWRGDYETRCIKECDIDKHLKHFEDDYCGECIEDELSATKAPNKNANKCNCYSDCDDHDLCTIDQIIHENNEHFCVHTPKICVEGYSCNPADGECSTQAQLFVGQSTIPGLLVTTTESPDVITKTAVPELTTTAIMTTLIPMTTATAEIATSTSATSYVMSTSSTGATIATTSPTTTAAATITPTPKMNDSTSASPPSNVSFLSVY